ncbi:MAG: molybdenum cofactor cytidylyltransferase [Betaproteobacteria bacterium]|nr:molybdenum cofactor cytidylyltransferase [Betaproteobacteria bacterium]
MESQRNVTGIVLAAGEGLRMGVTKQLLPFRGTTILECVVNSALASSLQQVIVVLGHQAEEIAPTLKNRNLSLVVNPGYRLGQSTSLKAGLRTLAADAEAVLFLLGDQPLVTPAIINLILGAYRDSGSPIVMPVFAGRRGNPVLFSKETFSRMESLSDDCGARSLFGEYAARLLTVSVADPAIHFDIDTQEDYQRLLQLEHSDAAGTNAF